MIQYSVGRFQRLDKATTDSANPATVPDQQFMSRSPIQKLGLCNRLCEVRLRPLAIGLWARWLDATILHVHLINQRVDQYIRVWGLSAPRVHLFSFIYRVSSHHGHAWLDFSAGVCIYETEKLK